MGARERLLGYAGLYAKVFADGGRLCLCGVFAADAESLPAPARQATAEFFADQQRWVAGVLAEAGLPASRTRPRRRRHTWRRWRGHCYWLALTGSRVAPLDWTGMSSDR
ncbi:hypothetical protein [Salinispora arenicola]|uniref:hypothetical protein n=1 Tax=Salinispora arenicola TaxID=168697 RepID=UPI0027DC87E2|nr:hypothetical protein [Salinispora arenicola]